MNAEIQNNTLKKKIQVISSCGTWEFDLHQRIVLQLFGANNVFNLSSQKPIELS